MKTKDTSIITTALSWLEEPEFIESSERLAESLTSSFPLDRVEALTIVIIEAMCNHNVIATKKKIREVLTGQFGIKLTDADMKASERLFDIISSGRLRGLLTSGRMQHSVMNCLRRWISLTAAMSQISTKSIQE